MQDTASIFGVPFVSIEREIGAYEAIWAQKGATVKTIADLFRNNPGALPSELFDDESAIEFALNFYKEKLKKANISNIRVRINGTIDYPEALRDAVNPLELFYFRGDWRLAEEPKRVAIVGSRKPTEEGIRRAVRLTKLLVEDGFVIVSGLAKGIDHAAHTTAIAHGGKTVAVIGTPITESYPPEHAELQELIATEYLLISQVPFLRYSQQNYKWNKLFFPERNATMSALTQATIIVEAGETSGTLTQARAALAQGRKLFILDSCFQNTNITWPARFQKKGAIRVSSFDDIKRHLSHEETVEN